MLMQLNYRAHCIDKNIFTRWIRARSNLYQYQITGGVDTARQKSKAQPQLTFTISGILITTIHKSSIKCSKIVQLILEKFSQA